MSSSGLSDLSLSPSTDEDIRPASVSKGKLEHYFKQGPSATPTSPPAKKKRAPSPPHEYVLADNEHIPFICIFRSRFSDAFPKSLPHYGPQDVESGVVDSLPGEQVERLLCALLGLILNRKKDIEKGHYNRALEEAIQTHASQWPSAWQSKNPLHGGGSFNKMTPEERLTLLKALIIWSLGSSEAVQAIMKESYKRSRQDDDLNQPLSVQPWGRDGDKRRFWLIEGQDDTHFRLYRESNPSLRHVTWRSIAGTIDEVKEVAEHLGEESSLLSRRLRDRIQAAVPRFEASEDKRRRRDYRLARKTQFIRPEPGFSLYEGRTRGKRMKYTYSDEEDAGSDTLSTRRSNRQSGISTPAEPNGPMFTASGRQVRSRHGGAYGESILSGQGDTSRQPSFSGVDGADEDDKEPVSHGRPRRAARQIGSKSKTSLRKHIDGYNALDSMDDESDASSSGGEWEGGDDDEPDDLAEDEEDEDVEMSGDEPEQSEEANETPRSLVVSLRYLKSRPSPLAESAQNPIHRPTNHHSPPTLATSVDILLAPSKPTTNDPQPLYGPPKVSAVPSTPSDPSVPVGNVPRYSQDPTYSFNQNTAYDKLSPYSVQTGPPTHVSLPDVPPDTETIPVSAHILQHQPEAKDVLMPDLPRPDAGAGGIR